MLESSETCTAQVSETNSGAALAAAKCLRLWARIERALKRRRDRRNAVSTLELQEQLESRGQLPSMTVAISLENVSFAYRTQPVVQNVSLEIPQHSLLALIGPNGSGKTTLLRLMSKVLQPQHGQISLDGQPLQRFAARDLARKLAVISSEQHFEFPFSVENVVSMGRFPHRNRLERMRSHDWNVVEDAMDKTDVLQFRHRPISQLSSGEKQRVLVARAIAQQPSILMLDEPNAHLDINHQIAVFKLLRLLNRQHRMTIIVVLHDLSAAAALCETIVLLHRGRIVRIGTPAEVITPELIRQTYGAEVVVFPSPVGGCPQVAFDTMHEPAGP
ncbi:MAG: ABC transporter ATP-binding protein [Acidimicrobiia bacterium]|nr:ABC transporter ATP-binding protein [Acidimicrobiia bacterium]